MGLFDIDLTRPRRVKAADTLLCTGLVLVLVVIVALAADRLEALWLLLAAVPFGVASAFWLVADRAAQTAEHRGQDPYLREDLR